MTHHVPERDSASRKDPTVAGTERSRLRLLSEADDFEVAEGNPDIRGWRVFDAEANAVGTVHDLVADLNAMQVRYMDVKLERDTERDKDRHVLVPIGGARLSADVDAVTLRNLRLADLRRLPAFEHDEVDRDYERRLRASLLGDSGPESDDDFYRHEHFDTAMFASARQRGAGTTVYALVARRPLGGNAPPDSSRR